jgi:mono/diheme cytochrome c family protein
LIQIKAAAPRLSVLCFQTGEAQMKTIVVSVVGGALVVLSLPAWAGEPGDVFRGDAYAQGMCQSCHSITADGAPSPNPAAAPFQKIAATFAPGDDFATWFNTKHPPTPNSTIAPSQASDLVSYISSLKPGAKPAK